MLQSVNIESDSSQGKTSAVHMDLIPLNPDTIFYMSVEGLTIIEIWEKTWEVTLSCFLNLILVHLLSVISLFS